MVRRGTGDRVINELGITLPRVLEVTKNVYGGCISELNEVVTDSRPNLERKEGKNA